MLGDAGHLDQGIASAQRSIDLNAPYGYAHRALATLCRRAQRWHAAIEALREESRLFPKNAAGRIELAWLLATCPDSELRNIDEALRRARTAIEQGTPIPANWWTVFGVASYRAGDWDGAIAALSETKPITHRGYTHAARFFLAMAHWNRGDRDQAHQWYADTINWMNGNTTWMQDHPVEKEELERFRAEAAALLALDTRAPEAKATADASTPTPKNDRLTAEEDLARAYLNLGKLLISRGDRAEALDRYAHALVILPNVLSLRRARVYTLAELGRWDEVREEFDRLAADRPDDLEVQFESAGALLAVGDSETYRRLCVDLLERINNKSSARSVYLAARIGAMGRDATDPLLTLELAVKGDQREPRRPYTLHTLALAQYRAGRWDEALRSVDASIAAMPTWSGHICNWLLLAIIHERIGHHDEARQWADKAAHWRQQAYGDIPAGAFPAPDMHVHDRWGCLLLQREVDDLLEAGSSDGENSSDQTIPPPDSTAKPAADAGAPGD
jgi:tetratricopeptide (TPR) repeat protein